MINVVILGAGNLAFHLTETLLNNKAVNLIQVYNRSISKIDYLKNRIAITNEITALKDADIYIISVSDNAISELSSKIDLKGKLIVHTSGAAHLKELKSKSNKGVFYPLQSFSKGQKLDFDNIPICIEATSENDFNLLKELAQSISSKCFKIDSAQRKTLHVAAVFVNNFVNHMYYLGNDICAENNIPFEILHPLIKETSNKIIKLPPFEAQTGPAIRNDSYTIQKHISSLNEDQQNIYSTLTKSILRTYGKKL